MTPSKYERDIQYVTNNENLRNNETDEITPFPCIYL